MKPNELKILRNSMDARQKDLARILNIPVRTYQNWEQKKGSNAYRRIPDEYAERVRCLAELQTAQNGSTSAYPDDLIWLQIPLKEEELRELKIAAVMEDKKLALYVREALFSRL